MRKWISAQKLNSFLWTPVFLGFGIALYFSLYNEPGLVTLAVALCAGVCGIIAFRKIPILALVMCFIAGFGYAGIYTRMQDTPMLAHDTHEIEITGQITGIETTSDKTRIYMSTRDFGNIRVSTADSVDANVGDTISGTGGLFKPKPADVPNGFDFARHAYFNDMTATGYIKDIKTLYTADSNVYSVREYIKNKSNSFLSNALLLGYKNAISPEQRDTWNANGIAHLWSISGYHMGIIAGWLFIVFYMIFRCIPKLVRRTPARLPATVCAWCGLVGYLFISGCGVATLRAFLMTTLVMVAVIVGRRAISLRMASMAFIILAIINPYYVMRAGFQLSFAAIFGIMWLWQNVNPRMPNNRILKYIYAAFLTTLVATVFTTPFVLLHFGEFPIYGIIGNMIFLPLFSFILMPCVIIGTICAVFWWHAPLNLAHSIYDKLFHIAERISALPHGNITFGIMPNESVIFIITGLACLIIIRNLDSYKTIIARHINIVLAITFCTIGIIIWASKPRPVFYISNDHKLIGAVQDGKLKFNKSHDSGNYFAFDTWRKSNGEMPSDVNERLPKESGVYTILINDWKLVYIQNFVPLSRNLFSICNDESTRYIASYFKIDSEQCGNKIIHGGAVVYRNGRVIYVPSHRLWHNPPE